MLKQFPNWFINIFCVCMCACSSIQEVLTSKASWPVLSGTAQTEMNGHASQTCLLDAAAWVSLLQWSPVPGACRRRRAMMDPHSRMVICVQASSVNVGVAAFHKRIQCIKKQQYGNGNDWHYTMEHYIIWLDMDVVCISAGEASDALTTSKVLLIKSKMIDLIRSCYFTAVFNSYSE